MIVGKFAPRPPLLSKPLEDGDGGGGLNIVETDDSGAALDGTNTPPDDQAGDTGGSEDPDDTDRGDVVDPATIAALTGVPVAPAPAATADPADAAGGSNNRVPQARVNEITAQRNAERERAEAAERRVAELEAAAAAGTPPAPRATPAPTAAPAPAYDVRKAEREYAELLADGEFDKAADLRMTINEHVTVKARESVFEEIAEQAATQTINQVATQAVVDFPFLDTAEGATAMTAILAERARLERGGMAAAEALQTAVDSLAPRLAPAGFVAPQPRTPGKGSTAGSPAVDTRPARAAARGAAADARQPPALRGGQGNAPTGTVDVEDLDETQFEALTPAEKKRLRGD